MPTRLLAIGDIHLGRTTRRLPDGLDPARLGPEAALRAAIRTARALDVSAVLLAGDVADQEHDLYHAHGVLTDVLGQLGAAGIPVLAVAGNHDHETLPRLAAALPDLRILGRDGTWEMATITGDGGPVRVLGWSFPTPHHPTSPVVDLPTIDDAVPTIGLVHADLDVSTSRYAPVTRRELGAAGPVRWLLGHVHQPSLSLVDEEPGYLGSLVGLHPGEVGPRGPWLVEVASGRITMQHLVQAPLIWLRRDLAVDDLADPRLELAARVADALRELAADPRGELDRAEAIGVRLRLVGRATDYSGLAAAVAELGQQVFPVVVGGQTLFADAIINAATPHHDLKALSEQDDLPGILARDLLAVSEGKGIDVLQEAREVLQRVDVQTAFATLDDREHTDEELRARILRNGYQLLDDLLASREAPRGPA